MNFELKCVFEFGRNETELNEFFSFRIILYEFGFASNVLGFGRNQFSARIFFLIRYEQGREKVIEPSFLINSIKFRKSQLNGACLGFDVFRIGRSEFF